MIKYPINLPLVSICVSVYNRAQFLPQCLESIINQTYKNLEIIIIYNTSTDNSLEVIKQYIEKDSRIKIIYLQNEGPPGTNSRLSMQVVYNSCKGDYIGSVDSDDYIALDCIEKCLDNIKDYGLIYTYCRQFGDSTLLDTKATYPYTKENLLDFFSVFHFRLFTKESWNKIKELSDVDYCWDYDLVLRLSEVTNFVLLPEVLYYWRRHKNQMTNSNNISYIKECLEKCRYEAKKRRGLII